jgi:plastocyanin
MRKSVFVLIAVLALGLAACSSDDGGGEETGSATGGSTGAAGGDCVDLTGEGAVFTITISDFAFVPDCFTASAAQGITVVNEDSSDHTFTMAGTPIDAPIAAGGTFNGEPITGVVEPGTYDLLCTIHPSMTGEVTVVA